jgi:DNA polymerase-3 subunit delta'
MIEIYPWQQHDYQSLLLPYLHGRLSHALILSGAKGIGKRQLANTLGHRLLCDLPLDNEFACGQCHSCTMLKAMTHPDLYTIEPEEKSQVIKIEQIRDLISKIMLSSYSGKFKVVIIDPAEAMTIAAANSLLKTLEEPPDKTLFLLVASDVSRLPMTIRSRCQQINIATPDPQSANAWLNEKLDTTISTEILLSLAAGAPLTALSLSNQTQLENRDKMLEEWCQLANGTLDPVQIASKWVKPDANLPINWIQGWIIDMICLMTGFQKTLTNPDKKANLLSIAQRFDITQLYKLLDVVEESKNLLKSQVNAQSLLENILIYWSHLPSKHKQ